MFTQIVLVIGVLKDGVVQMRGTGFLIRNDGLIATAYHVVGSKKENFVVLLPKMSDLNQYQDLSDKSCDPIKCNIERINTLQDVAILKADMTFYGILPLLSSFDTCSVGEDVGIFGYPHCSTDGRRSLTYQKTEIGAKVLLDVSGIKSKQAVINTQTRPGQSGSPIVSLKNGEILGLLIGAWSGSSNTTISLGGIDPRELHQTTHCLSAEYISEML